MLNYILKKLKHLIKDKVAEGLITQNPRAPRFYTMPLIQKEGIPGRPVISSVNCHSLKMLELPLTTNSLQNPLLY